MLAMRNFIGACVAIMISGGCSLYSNDDAAALPDAGEEVDAGGVVGCAACGEWALAVNACDAELTLHIRIGTDRGVPFVLSLDAPIAAAGVVLEDDSARVYVKDAANTMWALELVDDGEAWSATGALDVNGCEYVGDLAVTDRVRRGPAR